MKTYCDIIRLKVSNPKWYLYARILHYYNRIIFCIEYDTSTSGHLSNNVYMIPYFQHSYVYIRFTAWFYRWFIGIVFHVKKSWVLQLSHRFYVTDIYMKYGDAHRYVVLFAIYLSDCHYKSLHCDREMMIFPVFNRTHMILKSFEYYEQRNGLYMM